MTRTLCLHLHPLHAANSALECTWSRYVSNDAQLPTAALLHLRSGWCDSGNARVLLRALLGPA